MKKILTILIGTLMVLSLSSCNVADLYIKKRILDYYKKDDNYKKITARVEHVSYSDSFDDVSIRLFVLIDDSSEYVNYSTNKFIAGWSSNKCELLVDDIYVFLTGDKMFFDGQTMPIVSVEKDGVILLPFEQGKENYLNHIRGDMRLGPFDL